VAPGAASAAPEPGSRAALRARWEALADSMAGSAGDDDDDDEPTPLPAPLVIKPRRRQGEASDDGAASGIWKPGSDDIAPHREPNGGPRWILREPGRQTPPRTQTGDGEVVVAARTKSDELWSEPTSIPPLADSELRPRPGELRAAEPAAATNGEPARPAGAVA